MRSTQRGGMKQYIAKQSYLNLLYKNSVKLQAKADKAQQQSQ